MYPVSCMNRDSVIAIPEMLYAFRYRKFPKYSDTQKIVVITLKVEQDGVSLE